MTVENGDALKIVLDYIYPGAGTALNIFHYLYLGVDTDDVDVTDSLVEWATNQWGPTWRTIASDQSTLNQMSVQTVDVAGNVLRDLGVFTIGITGDDMETVLPAANSAYLQANTDIPQVRGSKYVPGISERSTEGGVFTAPALAAMALLLLDYLALLDVNTIPSLLPVVRSERELGFPRLLFSGAINILPAYQRRRKEGVGI